MKSADAVAKEPGGDLAGLREQNLRRILGALLGSRQGLSQQRLVELTALSRSTVSSLLSSRLEGVLRVETRRHDENSGRPVKAWRIDPSACYSVGVDIGHTHVSAVLIDVFGNEQVAPMREATANALADPHETLALATDMVTMLVRASGIACEKIAAITVGLPGPVDLDCGEMADAATRSWVGIDVREEIEKRWPEGLAPRRLADNKANLGALAEYRLGAGHGVESLVFLDWSYGVGAGLVLGGRLWRGHSGVAAEIGHLAVAIHPEEADALDLPADRAQWEACDRCGRVDCLDKVAGGRTVSAAVGVADLSEVVRAALAERGPATEKARTALGVAATLIGRALGPAITLLNLDRVIVGGAAGEPSLYPLLVGDLSKGIEETAFNRAWQDASLAIGTLGAEAPVIGAAILGFDQFAIDFLIDKARSASEGDIERVLLTSR